MFKYRNSGWIECGVGAQMVVAPGISKVPVYEEAADFDEPEPMSAVENVVAAARTVEMFFYDTSHVIWVRDREGFLSEASPQDYTDASRDFVDKVQVFERRMSG